jgi:hypothetical protein
MYQAILSSNDKKPKVHHYLHHHLNQWHKQTLSIISISTNNLFSAKITCCRHFHVPSYFIIMRKEAESTSLSPSPSKSMA